MVWEVHNFILKLHKQDKPETFVIKHFIKLPYWNTTWKQKRLICMYIGSNAVLY